MPVVIIEYDVDFSSNIEALNSILGFIIIMSFTSHFATTEMVVLYIFMICELILLSIV